MKYQKPLIRGSLLGALAALSFAAAATDDDEVLVCDRESFEGCLNGVSSSVTNGAGLRTASSVLDDIARERSEAADAPGEATAARFGHGAALAAGDGMGGSVFGMWASYSYNDFDSDFSFQGTPLGYDADAHSMLAGIDRLFSDRILLGAAFGYSTVETETVFNGGGQDTDGFTVAPYAAVLLTDVFSVDVSGGYTTLDYDQDRISPADGTDIKASFDADRWFVQTNLNAVMIVDSFVFGAKVGYLYTDEEQDAYVETGSAASATAGRLRTVQKRNIDLEQIVAGGEIAYMAGAYEPFFLAEYRNDLSRSNNNGAGGLPGNFTSVQSSDDDEVQLSFGVRFYTNWGVTSSFEYQRVEGRSSFDSDLFMFTLRAAL